MKTAHATATVLRRLLLTLALAAVPLCSLAAAVGTADNDSVAGRVVLLAARGDAEALRPLMEENAATLPRDVRLYGEMALARADRRWQRVVECVDTLTTDYDSRLDIKTRLSLSMLKAETLRHMGDYAAMARYCDDEVRYYRGRHVKKTLLTPFQTLARHGRRLGGSDARSEALRLADLDEAFTLQRRHADRLAALDDYARRRCRLTLAAAFGRHHEAAALADSLLRESADSLEPADRLLCLHTAARALAAVGDWKALKAFVDAHRPAEAVESGTDILQHYRRMAATLGTYAATAIEHPLGEFESYVGGEYPAMISASLDGSNSLLFSISTGIPHTTVAAADTVGAGLVMVDDAVDILTPIGLQRARPALCPRLAVGSVMVTNALVYVLQDADGYSADGLRTLGLDLLMKFGSVTIWPERLVHAGTGTGADGITAASNLRLTADHALRAEATVGDSVRTFLVDTDYAENILSPQLLQSFRAAGRPFAPQFGGVSAAESAVSTEGEGGFGADGVLGYPFVSANRPLTLDFRTMTLRVPTASERVAPSHSPLYVLRNYAALEALAGDPATFIPTAAQYLLWTNRPQAFTASAYSVFAQEDAGRDAAAIAAWDRCRRTAAVQLGRYAEAAAISTAEAATADEPGNAALRHFPATAEPALALSGAAVSPYTDAATLTTGCTVNDKEATMRPDLTLSPTVPVVISSKTAKRLKVKTYYQPKDKNAASSYGLVEELRIGTATLRNVLCRIDPGKDETLRYGTALLRLLPKVKYGKAGMAILAATTPSPSAAPMLLADGLTVQGETPTGFADVRLTTAPAEAAPAATSLKAVTLSGNTLQMPYLRAADAYELSLPQVVKAGRTVTLDFNGMFFTLD